MASLQSGVVHLWDLPPRLTYVGLDKEFQKSMILSLKQSCRYLVNVSKCITPHMLYNLKNNGKRKIRLDMLWKISNILIGKGLNEFSKENIERSIKTIGTKRGNVFIINPKLPFNFNSESGAYFISAILFDGGIDEEAKPHYGNIYFSMRNRIKESAIDVFGEMKHREINPKRGFMIRFPRIIGILLNNCFNIGIGNKVYHDNKIPDFVLAYSDELKSYFLRQAFDDDGNVSSKKHTIRISETIDVDKKTFGDKNSKPTNLIIDLEILLKSIGIKPNKLRLSQKNILSTEYRKKGPFYRHVWNLSINGIENIRKFNENVGFNLDYKQKELTKLLGSYRVIQRRRGEVYSVALQKFLEIQNKQGYFTSEQATKELGITYRYAARIIQKMLKRKIISIFEVGHHKGLGGGRFPNKYVVKDLRKGGRILADGKVIQKNGKWRI